MQRPLVPIFAWLAVSILVAAGSSCGLIAGVPSISDGGSGGSPPMVTCKADEDCDDGDPCTTDTCGQDKLCARDPVPDGSEAPALVTEGDCKRTTCKSGKATSEPEPQGTVCEDADGHPGVCDTDGKCVVECVVAADCVSTNPCQLGSCAQGICVFSPTAESQETPGIVQTPGDCHTRRCKGGVDLDEIDDTDLPLTPGTDCDEERCDSGVPSNPPKDLADPCSTYMGGKAGFCDGKGTCGECTKDADCSGTTDDCQHPVCNTDTFTCQPAYTPAMTPTVASPQQTPGDCATIVCDGAGNTMLVLDSSDPEDDGNTCTTDTCAGVKQTNHPNAPNGSACGVGGTTSCLNGTCSGCTMSSQCPAASCSGTVLTKAQTCNGMGQCVQPSPATQDCAPYLCSTATGSCTTSCTNDAGCAAGNYCAPGGFCVTKGTPGTSCAGPNQCQSNFCVDGVCCNTACTGTCVACSAAKKGGGNNGVCGPIANGTDPDNECPDDGAFSCDRDGFCSGNGTCRSYAAGTVCVAASCSGNTLINQRTCNGTGTCQLASPQTTDCSPNLCSINACTMGCVNDFQCASGSYCNGGTCAPKLPQGSACTGGNQCQSTFCVDGYCCGSACNTPCQACAAALKQSGFGNGNCGNAAVFQTDPRSLCGQSPPCGNNGLCGFGGSCQVHDSTTSCMAASCTGSTIIAYTQCNGMGTCTNGGTTAPCPGNLVCQDANTCFSACGNADPISDAKCVSTHYCDGFGVGSCQFKLAPGAFCTRNGECQNGNCFANQCQ